MPTTPTASTVTRPNVMMGFAAAASLAAGVVHAAAAGSHDGERPLAVAFAVVAIAQVAWAAAAVAPGAGPASAWLGRATAGAGVALHGTVLVAWATSRVRGIGAFPGLEEVQPVSWQDATASALAASCVVAVVAAAAFPRLPALRAPWGAAMAAVALAVAVPAMVVPHPHDGSAGHAAAPHHPGPSADRTEVALPDVAGVTAEQRARAARLIAETRAAMKRYPDVAAVEAAGFVSIGDAVTGFEHFVHRGWLVNTNVLDPHEPESIVFEVEPDGTRIVVSAMYILPPGATMADVPDVAGAMTPWHDHQNLCWDDAAVRVVGLLVNGQCRPAGTFRPTPPMLHVWVVDNPCGPFAGIEGGGHPGACHAPH